MHDEKGESRKGRRRRNRKREQLDLLKMMEAAEMTD